LDELPEDVFVNNMIQKTNYYSYKLGNLAKGCQYCVKGSKLVLFVTGLCPRCCYYCPISDKKYKKDVVYADEWPTKNIKDIIKEAESIDAEGAGITGGDPLCRLDRTISFIKTLKHHFGKKFHTHLYTSFNLINRNTLKKLYSAGLNEIRFHADLDSEKFWDRIMLANDFDWDIGIEIPSIPGKFKETKKMIDFFQDKIDFLNLNELEFADNSFSKLPKSFKTKDKLSYAVKGSEEMALVLLKYINQTYPKLNVHFCTAKLKDKVQLANRIKRRAKNISKDYDEITDEGLLFRGAIYTKDISQLKKYNLKKNMFDIDQKRNRILVSASWLNKNKEKLKKQSLKIAFVEEYPTQDCLNVMTDWL
jgi:pyruvate formate-lyase activating enzyme-like uncharacterized protein